MQRLTISLDDDMAAALDEIQVHAGDSKATLIRRALRFYLNRQKGRERPTETDLTIWTELLANREHVIMDVAHARLLFTQCVEAPDAFWRELYEIGEEHGRQYRDKGCKRVEEMLDVMQSANWFLVAPESDRSWALVFTEPSARPFVKTFLAGFFSEWPQKVELIEERTKMRIRVASSGAARDGSRSATARLA